jgi:UDP-N-acetylmuramoyl-L-alanyl-D-glutamate--2,6-diaminopimelate ligase
MGELRLPDRLAQNVRAFVRARDTRRALAAASHLHCGEPTKRLALAGVTGTKGKTTTAYMIRSILEAAHKKSGMLGTVANYIGDEVVEAKATTPDSAELARYFALMAERGCEYAAMEVSSQGLALSRVDFCDFDVGVFTNFYEDHISPYEHKDIGEYFAAKLRLFSMCKRAVINADIGESRAVADAYLKGGGGEEPIFYSADESSKNREAAAVRASSIRLVNDGKASSKFYAETPWYSGEAEVGLPGRYNVSNALAAISVCGLFGIPEEAIRRGLRDVSVRGRTESVGSGGKFSVLVDFAHNAASLEALLRMLREYEYKSITTVFGCGGERDRERRFAMGEISGRHSDFTVVTSDNPRGEDPKLIIEDILTGMRKTGGRYAVIEDRRDAIGYAIGNAAEGDLVLIAGKGHETTQTVADRTIPFDDAQVAREFLNGAG